MNAASLLLLVFCLLMCFTDAVRTNEKSKKKARELAPSSMFDHQLLDNVVSSCHKLLIEKPTLTSAADGIIEVVPSVPSMIEQTAYTRLPTTKTRANAALARGEVLGVSKVESWRKSDNNWQLPRDHIRNDKDRCVNASIASSQRTMQLYQVKPIHTRPQPDVTRLHVLSIHSNLTLYQDIKHPLSLSIHFLNTPYHHTLYHHTLLLHLALSLPAQEMKQDTSAFYLLHTRHALVHPTGIILKQCGYIQPHEACETIFRFLGMEHNKT